MCRKLLQAWLDEGERRLVEGNVTFDGMKVRRDWKERQAGGKSAGELRWTNGIRKGGNLRGHCGSGTSSRLISLFSLLSYSLSLSLAPSRAL